ncbi:mycofactocin biosynthesis peptidyl-dipeptidase MftE [Kineosporia succinea]|uniref:Creatinine amidohydrolase n=1 Tax=Kineosporia succinea TaxID=84632 RepID=A0ABT9P7G9_9ACTN|nr:mycofactocin biosynthesis peptidyl-dipeptidase MftE [Kineosporia succinea]MDP9828496.1 creatinine amidohydrolase [Kineosporia succinea]
MSYFDLAAMTSPQIAEHAAAGGILVVPIGSTEQHGPHLPLGTDRDVAVAVARRLAERMPQVALAPAIGYGSSGEHAGFAGTISIGQEALEFMLLELGRSAGETYRRQVYVNAHGGNAVPAVRAVRKLRAESRDVLLWMATWDGDAHAGRTETSLQLALHPELVYEELAEAGNTTPVRELISALRAGGLRAVTENGVLGDPAGASAEEGERLVQRLVDGLHTQVVAWDPPYGKLGA